MQGARQYHDGTCGKASYPEPAVEPKVVERGGTARGQSRPGEVDGGGGLVTLTNVCDDDVAVDVDAHGGAGLREWGGRLE